jgi:hypothetical protein
VAKQSELVVELETVPRTATAPVVAASASAELSTFERLASTPGMNVENLERLMQMHERMQARSAEQQFNAAMSAAQHAMRPIAADAENPSTRSRYASYAQLDRALRPIYTTHGFGISFDTADSHKDEHVRVLGYVTHTGGHARTYHVDMPADGKGAKGGDVMTKTHAAGAAMSYGMRYLLKMIFNVAVGEDDRDGNAPSERSGEPAGYDDWLTDLSGVADNGWDDLKKAFNASRDDYKHYLTMRQNGTWENLKKKAAAKRGAR